MHHHLLHLVRHGEVENPDRLVYADMPGFGLSERGWSERAAFLSGKYRHVVAVNICNGRVDQSIPVEVARRDGFRVDTLSKRCIRGGLERTIPIAVDDVKFTTPFV